jgi:hypothetical protein
MKTAEIITVFLVSAILAGVAVSVFRRRETFAVYDEQGNLVDYQQA